MELIRYARTFNPRWVITVLVIAVLAINFAGGKWKNQEVIRGKVLEYYAPLPGIFYGAATPTSDQQQAPAVSEPVPNTGMLISYLPFFALAHIVAKVTGLPADGFSAPYQALILLSSLVYFVIGMIFLAKLLRLHFPGHVSSITLLSIAFGSNAFYYITAGAGHPFAVSFALLVLFLYQTVAWYQLRNIAAASQTGLLLGAMWLVNSANILVLLVFLLYDVRSLRKARLRLRLFLRKPLHFLLLVFCCLVVMLPQIALNRITPESAGEVVPALVPEFQWPQVIDGLFGAGNGWIRYSPVMLIAVAGLFFLGTSARVFTPAIPVFFVVYLCMVLWLQPQHAYGQPAMIDIYPALALPFGAVVYKLRRLGGWFRRVLYLTIMLLVALNIYQTTLATGVPS